MSELGFILYRSDLCPRCGRKSLSRDARICKNCDQKVLFHPEDDAQAQKWLGENESFYIYFAEKTHPTFSGWVYGSHLNNPAPIMADYKTTDLPPENYGKRELPKNCSASYPA